MYNLGVAYGELLRFEMVSYLVWFMMHESFWTLFHPRYYVYITWVMSILLPGALWCIHYICIYFTMVTLIVCSCIFPSFKWCSCNVPPPPCWKEILKGSNFLLEIIMNCNCFLSFLIDIKDTLYYLVQAIVFYELAFHFNPQCAEACNNLGVIYKDRENLDKAVECYQVITIDLSISWFTNHHCFSLLWYL